MSDEGVLDLEDLEEIERGYRNAEVRDPGLYPRFTYFHANYRNGYLRYISGYVNVLVSEFHLEHGLGDAEGAEPLPHARMVFLDSGAISALNRCTKGQGTGAEVRAWLNHQPAMIDRVHDLYQRGCALGIVGTMDAPQYADGLAAAGMSSGEALEITLENARAFKDDLAAELPPGWKPAYMLQGPTQDAYLDCIAVYESLGIIADAQRGDAWLSVGGTLATSPPALYTIYRTVREAVGPEPHIHALGVGREREVVHMARRGWINGSDSTSSAMKVVYNGGPYHCDGPRTEWFQSAQFAAQAMYSDAVLARAIAEADAQDIFEQEALVF